MVHADWGAAHLPAKTSLVDNAKFRELLVTLDECEYGRVGMHGGMELRGIDMR